MTTMSRHFTSFISQQFGRFASHEFSATIQNLINKGYVSIMGLDMSEFHSAVTYKTLNKLFTRSLKQKREFSNDTSVFISPCDSFVTELGDLDENRALQIKGMSYSVDDFLGSHISNENKEKVKNGQYINFYLSPKDYHRYHIPTNLQILKAVHIPGKLYPVNMPALNNIKNLFIENERVVIEAKSNDTLMYMVLVGALNVGKMQVAFEPRIETNSDKIEPTLYEYDNLFLNKGDDFGSFIMGSTLIFITESDTLNLKIEHSTPVKFAQEIASFK